MNKKLIAALCVGMLSISLVGCNPNKKEETAKKGTTTEQKKDDKAEKKADSKLKDGTFEVETKAADDKGYKVKASITVKGGKIEKATYNEFNDKGNKRDEKEYNAKMKEKAKTNPSEYEVKFEEQVVAKQGADIDGVTGATGSSAKAKQLFEAAVKNAEAGKTKDTIELKSAK